MRRWTTEVLGHQTKRDGDDGYELFLSGVSGELLRYPVFEVTLRVAVTTPIEVHDPTREAAEEAAELLLGGQKPTWWKRWLASEAEKMRGMRWRVSS
jgi:hypothetical protein